MASPASLNEYDEFTKTNTFKEMLLDPAFSSLYENYRKPRTSKTLNEAFAGQHSGIILGQGFLDKFSEWKGNRDTEAKTRESYLQLRQKSPGRSQTILSSLNNPLAKTILGSSPVDMAKTVLG